MERRTIYCSACDREVQVVLPEERDGSGAELAGSVCLDLGERCTGALCPVCAIPPDEIRDRLVRIGAAPAPD